MKETKKMLIIDDEEPLLEVLEEIFREEGFEVAGRTSADNVFSVIRDFEPDMILLDYILKNANGGELCCRIKRHPDTRHIPVAIISAYPRALYAADHCYDVFVEKPFELDDLISLVKASAK